MTRKIQLVHAILRCALLMKKASELLEAEPDRHTELLNAKLDRQTETPRQPDDPDENPDEWPF